MIKWILKFDFLFLHCNANPCDNSTIGRHEKALNFGVVWIVPREECNVHVPVLLVRSVLYSATGKWFSLCTLVLFSQWNWPPWYNLNLVERVMVFEFHATFNNISALSWQLVLLVEETRVPGENHRPVQVTDNFFSLNVIPRWAGFELATLVVMGTDYI